VSRRNNCMLNLYFHTILDGKVDKQGQVIGEVSPGYLLVQWFSWMDGSPTSQEVVPVVSLRNAKVYQDRDNWTTSGQKFYQAVSRG
jgi:hypothetical protein